MANVLTKGSPEDIIAYTHVSGDNGIASVGSAGSGQAEITDKDFRVAGVGWGYDAAPTDGILDVVVDGTVVASYPVTGDGPGGLPMYGALITWSTSIAFNLSAGGSGVIGYLTVYGA